MNFANADELHRKCGFATYPSGPTRVLMVKKRSVPDDVDLLRQVNLRFRLQRGGIRFQLLCKVSKQTEEARLFPGWISEYDGG
jgi:hypothetical protein